MATRRRKEAFPKRKLDSIKSLKAPTIKKPPRRVTLITNGNSSTTTNPVNKTQPRTTFLSLPREIRQAILISARPIHSTWNGEKALIKMRAEKWKQIHPKLEEDVEFAAKKWLENLTEELGETCFRDCNFLDREERAVDVYFGKYIWLTKVIGDFRVLNNGMREELERLV
jgi:hypothetical protein